MFDIITTFTNALNYPTLFFLMVLEGLGGPIPSEVLMPLVGVLSSQGKMDFAEGVLAGTLGSLSGSLIAYLVGAYLGYPVLLKYGKYIGITEREVNMAHSWFERYGTLAVFLLRFVPALRALISYPAGVARMRLPLFSALTLLGHTIWDVVLAYLGLVYGQSIIAELERSSVYLYGVAAIIIAYFLYKVVKVVKGKTR